MVTNTGTGIYTMTNPRRRIQPPQPVDVENPIWQARAWQSVFDGIDHLDECLDDERESNREMRASLDAWMIARKDSDDNLAERLQSHQAFHDSMDRDAKSKRSVWKQQGEWISGFFRIVTDAAVIGGAVLLLKALGVDL